MNDDAVIIIIITPAPRTNEYVVMRKSLNIHIYIDFGIKTYTCALSTRSSEFE